MSLLPGGAMTVGRPTPQGYTTMTNHSALFPMTCEHASLSRYSQGDHAGFPTRARLVIFLIFFCCLIPAAGAQSDVALFEKLIPLHQVKQSPEAHDWLAVQPEPGQTFAEYIGSNPVRPAPGADKIYIALLGDFSAVQEEIVRKTARFIEAYYALPVVFAEPVPLSLIPERARRVHPQTRDPQVLSPYIIENILIPRKPKDAFCFIAFTVSDLWPGEGWNFVFGQASLEDRVGVWSIYRNGDPHQGPGDYDICLRRTISTGIHEIGHMFSITHCVFYECNMNGSNHRRESDRRPLWFCPVDLRKLCWLTGINPLERYKNLATISRELGLDKEAGFFENSAAVLEGE